MSNINSMNKIENFLTPEELEKINNFFEEIYYKNDLVQYGNCYNYEKGTIEIIDIIDLINEFNLKITIDEE